MNEKVTTDATVSYTSATAWVETLYREDPKAVTDRATEAEPYVMALATHVATRTKARLIRNGVAEHIAQFAYMQVRYASALSIELMRRGNAELWRDIIEPTDDNEKGTTDEQPH